MKKIQKQEAISKAKNRINESNKYYENLKHDVEDILTKAKEIEKQIKK